MNGRYRLRLIVTHIRKLTQVHKLGQYSKVHFTCVYLKIKPKQLSKCVLYHNMMQYGITLSTKHPSTHPSETNNNFENSYFKINHFFAIFHLRLRYFLIKIILILNILPILVSPCFYSEAIDKKRCPWNEYSAMYSK